MRRCSRLALGALIWAALALPVAAGGAELVGSFVWRDRGDGFGGFSGFDLGPDGLGFAVVSDKSLLMTGQLQRDAAGRVSAVVVESRAWLMGPGKGRQASRAGDSEGFRSGRNRDCI